ncbi:MAG: ArnT family glycosyltransferase [Methylococcales bacterium]
MSDNPPVAVTVLQVLICTVLLSPILAYRMGVDQGIFAYIAERLLDGQLPYRDTWDHAFPGVMLIHAAELILFGKSIYLFRVFDLLWQLASAGFVFRITTRLAGWPAALLAACLYCLIYQGYGPWNTGQREGFAMLPVLWGFWLYLTAGDRNRLRVFAGIGFGLGLAILIKPTMLALAGLYVPLLVRVRRADLPGLLLAFGLLLLPTLLTTAFYAYQGALRDLYEACIRYQSEAYIHINRGTAPLPEYWWSKAGRLGGTTLGLMFGFPPFVLLARLRQSYLMLYLGFLGSVYAVFVQGTFAGYHYLPGLAIGAILIGVVFAELSARVPGDLRIRFGKATLRLDALLAVMLIAALVPHYIHKEAVQNLLSLRFLGTPFPNEYRNQTVFDFTESWNTAAYLREHTQPNERIQVWGHESLVYYLAERASVSRFQTSNPLVVHAPGHALSKLQQRWRAEFMRNMREAPPVYIAIVHDDHWWWSPGEQSSWQVLDEFPEWKQFILGNYSSETRIGRFEVFRHGSQSSL